MLGLYPKANKRIRKQIWIVAQCLLLMTGAVHGQSVDSERESAVQVARAGDLGSGIERLQQLLIAHPGDHKVMMDLGVLFAWSEQDQLALDQLSSLAAEKLPEYALSAKAKSARNVKQFEQAVQTYSLLRNLYPNDPSHSLGLGMSYADAGRYRAANATADQLESQYPEQVQAELLRGYINERKGSYSRALANYQRVLRWEPDHGEAQRRLILVAAALGAIDPALEQVAQTPELLSTQELQRMQLDQAAMHIRWSGLSPELGHKALEDATVALAKHASIQAALARHTPTALDNSLQYDQVVALTSAYRMEAAVAVYEGLCKSLGANDRLPAYVQIAAGDAYLYLERPRQALRSYQRALTQTPDDFKVKSRLFYANSELNYYAQNQALMDTLQAGLTPWDNPSRGVWLANEKYALATEIAALNLAYQEEYDQALMSFDEILNLAPANDNFRLARARLLRWRGWHDQADVEVARTQHNDPDNVQTNVLSAHIAIDKYAYRRADQEIDTARERAVYNKGVVDVDERWLIHNTGEFRVRGQTGRSSGSVNASKEWRTDAHYYTAPIGYDYRLMLHDYQSYGRFEEGRGKDHRVGIGAEYRRDRLRVQGEVNKGIEDNDSMGTALEAQWAASDFWQFDGAVASNSNQMPLRGLRLGVEADALSLGTRYRWHENRVAGIRAGLLDMDDGNLRQYLGADYAQRLFNAPVHKLNGRIDLYSSRNSERGRIYFNPERDLSATGSLIHEWRVFREVDRYFTQRFTVEAGSYWQQNHGSGGIWTFGLEHEWGLGRRLSLAYGANSGGRRYDGKREHLQSYFLRLTGRL